MLSLCPSSTHLGPAKRKQALTMRCLLPQFPSILAVYCFCVLQILTSGAPQPLADPPDGLDIVQLEQLSYCLNQWAMLSHQLKFLFHYSRAQEPTHPMKSVFPPVHPLVHLAAKLSSRRTKRFLQQEEGAAGGGVTKKLDFRVAERNHGALPLASNISSPASQMSHLGPNGFTKKLDFRVAERNHGALPLASNISSPASQMSHLGPNALETLSLAQGLCIAHLGRGVDAAGSGPSDLKNILVDILEGPVMQQGCLTVYVFMLQDRAAVLGRPFFLFRPRNGRNIKDKAH
ncbi:neuromedin-S [Tupaia chinensis]|uniref:neuromedin-S n=1 Tax=Tupaia chinensis TaxID=246437 RepID=UPI000FFB653D|nr:neuromedin-S [Tupaia chinensis]